ncbi:MAG: dienelactone hydrolase family protein [Spirulina sp. DLM2.Bin59]|nr:MAG: dienelactone hydrolase family protein [Spirulina sp. DLM2.Bin59]
MTVPALNTTTVYIPNGDLAIQAYLAQPAQGGPHPAVIVIQEIFGVNPHIREITERIAQAGYVAIAPAIYQRIAPGYEAGYSEADVIQGRDYKNQTTAAELLSDMTSTIRYLYQLPTVSPAGVGTIGFCFGGHVAYLTATLPDVLATASFYGAGIATLTPGGGPATITRTPEIQGRIDCFFGEQDPLIPLGEVEQVATALATHGIDHRIHRYPEAGHGFMCDRRADYRPAAAEAAWQKVLELFHDQLSPTPSANI